MAKTLCVTNLIIFPKLRNMDGTYCPDPLESGNFGGSEEVFLQSIAVYFELNREVNFLTGFVPLITQKLSILH
jgi:hypothetical protein